MSPVDSALYKVGSGGAVTTGVFPNLSHDRTALKLNGRDDKLRRADFKTVATRASLNAATADEIIDRLIATMKNASERTN
jgi:serine/threonine-protein kinase HipA